MGLLARFRPKRVAVVEPRVQVSIGIPNAS